jgi:aldose 1-epimerase
VKVEIRSDTAVAVIDPSMGASLVAFTVDDLQITRRAIGVTDPREASMFTMTPWANRIERGKFATASQIHSIPPNADEPHPLHGHGWLTEWSVDDTTTDSVSLRYEHAADAWVWPYRAMLRYRIEPDRLIVDRRWDSIRISNDPPGSAPRSMDSG